MMHTSNADSEQMEGRASSLWKRILGLVEQDLAERCARELFVEVQGEEADSYHNKEIGELSASERQSLHPALRAQVVERLLDRYLAEQGRVDLLEKRRAYTKKIEELTPEDLPALIEADGQRAEEEHRKERERERFVGEARAGLEQLLVNELLPVEITEAGKEARR
jgi:hypothetical protein